MADIDTNQARLGAALKALELRISVMASGDQAIGAENQNLIAKIETLEAEIARLRQVGTQALEEIDVVLDHLDKWEADNG